MRFRKSFHRYRCWDPTSLRHLQGEVTVLGYLTQDESANEGDGDSRDNTEKELFHAVLTSVI